MAGPHSISMKQTTTIEYGVDNGFDRVTFDKEKFAELIIEEVMQELFINGHEDAFDFLNKHFGVEE